jgi:hypothetical protein
MKTNAKCSSYFMRKYRMPPLWSDQGNMFILTTFIQHLTKFTGQLNKARKINKRYIRKPGKLSLPANNMIIYEGKLKESTKTTTMKVNIGKL